MTWPLAAHLRDRVADRGDPMLLSWILPWTIRALFTQPLQLFQGNIFYPEPNTLAYADHMVAAAPIAAPAWLLTGDGILVNNVTVILLIALGGWSAYRLAFDVTGSRAGAAVAGAIFAFCPPVFSHFSHTNLLTTYAIPAAWLFARRLICTVNRRNAAGLAVSWCLAILSSWYYGVFVTISLIVLLGVELLIHRKQVAWRRLAIALGAVALIVGAVVFVFSRPYEAVRERYPQATRTLQEARLYSAVPSSFLAPPPENRVYGKATESFRTPTSFRENSLFPGVIPAVLAFSAVVVAARQRRFRRVLPWLAVCSAMVVFAFGPSMRFLGYDRKLPFYYLYSWFEPLRFIRAPGRAGVLAMLALSILAAMTIAAIHSRRTQLTFAVVAIALIGVEYTHIPIPLEGSRRPSEVHSYLASADVDGAVMELPTVTMDEHGLQSPGSLVREAWYASYSTKHWRPLLNGYSGFLPPTHKEMVERMQTFPSEGSIQFLRERGVAFVVVHRERINGTPWARLIDGIDNPSLKLLLDDGQARLYQLF